MNARRALTICASALAALAATSSTASAAAVRDGEGVTVTKSGPRVTFHFANTTRGRAAYRQIAGREITIACRNVPPQDDGAGITVSGGSFESTVHAGRRQRPITVRTGGPVDWCTVSRDTKTVKNQTVALLGVNAAGRTYLDEVLAATLLTVVDFAIGDDKDTSIAAVVAAGKGAIVALDGPEGTPPYGRVGYWTDGPKQVRVTVTKAGRRLFLETEGDVVRTNALRLINSLED